jgi:outer membrane lipoprotein-sorting protein
MLRSIRFGLFALPLCAVLAQTQPDVPQILRKVGQTYKAASDYELKADVTARENGVNLAGHMLFAFKKPDRYRMEGNLPGMGLSDSASAKAIVVDDGTTVWYYLPGPNQYASFPAIELTDEAPGDLGDMRPAMMDHFMMWRYRGAADFAARAEFLREETVGIGGAKALCYVVKVSPMEGESAYTWWIDKQRYLVLREDRAAGKAGSSTIYTVIKLGEPLSGELFKFLPPSGARKLDTQH